MCMEREGFVCCLRVCMAQVWLELKRWPIKACGALMKQGETTGDRWIKNKNHFQEEPMLLCSNLFLNLTVFLFTFTFLILTDTFFFSNWKTELMSNQPSCRQLTFHPLKVGFVKNVWRFQYPVCRFCFYSMTACVWTQLHTPVMAYKPVCDLSVCLHMQVHRLRERWAPTTGRPPCPLAISVPSLPLRRLRNDLGR